MTWDPERYLRFADHRTRPGLELMSRIPAVDARRIVDLGCGTGHLTARLAERWPEARVVGVDSSEEMIERAREEHPGLEWTLSDINQWEPAAPVDVIFSNSVLHWLERHEALFPRLRSFLSPGGVLAVQVPDNWDAPTHRVPATILDEGAWPASARAALLRDRLSPPASYLEWLQPAEVDLWRTTYYQRLSGEDPVWVWVTGSFLRLVLEELDEPDRRSFAAACRTGYAEAYPSGPDAVTTLPFSRLFVVAHDRGA